MLKKIQNKDTDTKKRIVAILSMVSFGIIFFAWLWHMQNTSLFADSKNDISSQDSLKASIEDSKNSFLNSVDQLTNTINNLSNELEEGQLNESTELNSTNQVPINKTIKQ